MNMKIIGCAGLAVLLSAACTKRTDVAVAPPPEKAVLRASTAALESGDTRTSFDDAAVLVWREGDAFGLFSDGSAANTKYELDPATAGSTDGRFTGDRIEGTDYFAYYPYGTASFTERTLSLTLPEVQQGTAGNFTAGQNPMVAFGNAQGLYFRSLCGVIKLQITGTHTVTKVVFRGNDDEAVAGAATVDMAYAGAPTLVLAADGSRTLTLDLGAGLALTDAPQSLYLVVPARTYAKGFTVTLTDTEGHSAVRSTSKSVTVARATIKPMARFEAEFMLLWSDNEGVLTNISASPAAGAADLSGQLANCYVIPTAGDYKIPVRLNDGTRIGEADYIGFTATGTEGNAVVMVEDENGKILWSWHIWCVNDLGTEGIPIGSYTYFDRNLGATAAGADAGEAAYGCLYQWGRKNPFPRNGLQLYQTLDEVVLAEGKIYVAEATATVAEAAAYPGVFFYVTGSNDWNTGHAEDLWQADTKTIFDPCPAGYEVPSIVQLRDLAAQPLTAGTGGCTVGGSWFPNTGYCESVHPVLFSIGIAGYGWSTEAFSSTVGSTVDYYAQNFVNTDSRFDASIDRVGYARGYGLPVRCVKIR